MEDIKMMTNSKPRIIKDYEKLDESIKEQIKLVYPNGFSQHLISFTNKDGLLVSALPFETDDKYYLVRTSQGKLTKINTRIWIISPKTSKKRMTPPMMMTMMRTMMKKTTMKKTIFRDIEKNPEIDSGFFSANRLIDG